MEEVKCFVESEDIRFLDVANKIHKMLPGRKRTDSVIKIYPKRIIYTNGSVLFIEKVSKPVDAYGIYAFSKVKKTYHLLEVKDREYPNVDFLIGELWSDLFTKAWELVFDVHCHVSVNKVFNKTQGTYDYKYVEAACIYAAQYLRCDVEEIWVEEYIGSGDKMSLLVIGSKQYLIIIGSCMSDHEMASKKQSKLRKTWGHQG